MELMARRAKNTMAARASRDKKKARVERLENALEKAHEALRSAGLDIPFDVELLDQ
jgi:hypothetical protein